MTTIWGSTGGAIFFVEQPLEVKRHRSIEKITSWRIFLLQFRLCSFGGSVVRFVLLVALHQPENRRSVKLLDGLELGQSLMTRFQCRLSACESDFLGLQALG